MPTYYGLEKLLRNFFEVLEVEVEIFKFPLIGSAKGEFQCVAVSQIEFPPKADSGTAFFFLLHLKPTVLIAEDGTIIPHQHRENELFASDIFALISICLKNYT